jgi:hypothetical protein
MTVDSSMIAGSVFYVCDSPILEDFEKLAILDEKKTNAHIKNSGRKYRFGEITCISGQLRIGIT